ncbi:MAG: 16S rRNA (uracil(1498)-N(3))-methyltransferase [Lachnospiraceae bacterium]|jgi:16S rRNA (uracil1498-N3)-methyltransferase|nr:16S rRNA (uracil(1498)-N(3))-methyltransferase [Lachnospiraceae bacterium]
MQHFFVLPSDVYKDEIVISGGDFNHIKNVLRMKVGEQLSISDGNNKRYICKIKEFSDNSVIVDIEAEEENSSELSNKIYLFQGLPKSDKMELIIQKCTELGVFEIIPVITKRVVVKLDDKKAIKKVERWNTIASSAAKQAGRGVVPKVQSPISFKEALNLLETLDIKLIPYELASGMEETRNIINKIRENQSIGIFIGPEGGFEKEEIEEAKKIGMFPITLGKRILRTETAGFALLSILMFQLENE